MERTELIKELQIADECVVQMGNIARKCPRHYATGMPQDSGQKATLQGFNTLAKGVDSAIKSGALYDETRIYVDEYGHELGREYSTWASNAALAIGIMGPMQEFVFELFKINADAHSLHLSASDYAGYVKNVLLSLLVAFGAPAVMMATIGRISFLTGIASLIAVVGSLFGYYLVFKSIIGYERLKEKRLAENDANYIKYAEQLGSLAIIQSRELPANALNHSAISTCIKKLQAGQATSIADCF